MSESCRGETTERTWFHCYALWLYAGQVESLSSSSENNLFPQKKLACTAFCNCPAPRERTADERGYSCHLTSALIFSFSLPPNTKFRRGWAEEHADKKQTQSWLTSLPTCLAPPPMRHRSVLGQFSDDRQWQSRAELHGSCLSSGCSVWCVFDVVQAHRRPRLWLLAHDTKLRQSWDLEGRKEGSTLPRQTTQKEKQQPVITQSVLTHCDIVQGLSWDVFSGKKKSRIKIKWK